MANIVQLKRSSVSGRVPDAGNVEIGEPVVNLADQIIFTKNTTGNVIVIGAGTTSNITEGTNLYFSNARVSATISSQTLGNATFSSNITAANVVITNASRLGNITSGVWNGSSISTTYTDAKVTSVNGQTGAATGFATTANSLSQFASTTSAQFASLISDETGSGNVVLSTSPVLTTPNIGTPSYAVLTNATGLPIVAGTTGTLSVARGGTGITSFGTGIATFLGQTPTSANLATLITDETGSGNLVFATSPTLVTPVLGLATGTSVMLSANVGAAAGNVSGNFTAGNFQTSGAINAASGTISSITGRVGITTDGGGAISLGNTSSQGASTPYLDFNSGATSVDYDARIMGSGGNGVSGNGTLTFTAAVSAFTGNVTTGNVSGTAGTFTLSRLGTVQSGTWNGSSISTTYTDAKVTSVNGQTGAATGFATTANTLSQFASTTSALLAGVISDETGSGNLVFATSPTLVTPVLGIATGTSVMLSANIGAAAGNVSGNFTAGNFQTVGSANVTTLRVSGVSNLGAPGNVVITGGSSGYVLSTDGSGALSWVAQPAAANITVDNFTGNGVQTAYTLSVTPSNINETSVNYNGVVQLRSAYSLAGAVLTFTEAPASNSLIEVTTTSVTAGEGGGSGTPGGSNTQVQFNDAGTFGGSSGFVFDKTSNALTVGGIISGGFLIENSQNVSYNYTITSGKSASSAGPITVDSGIVVTVPTGSRWVIL